MSSESDSTPHKAEAPTTAEGGCAGRKSYARPRLRSLGRWAKLTLGSIPARQKPHG